MTNHPRSHGGGLLVALCLVLGLTACGPSQADRQLVPYFYVKSDYGMYCVSISRLGNYALDMKCKLTIDDAKKLADQLNHDMDGKWETGR